MIVGSDGGRHLFHLLRVPSLLCLLVASGPPADSHRCSECWIRIGSPSLRPLFFPPTKVSLSGQARSPAMTRHRRVGLPPRSVSLLILCPLSS